MPLLGSKRSALILSVAAAASAVALCVAIRAKTSPAVGTWVQAGSALLPGQSIAIPPTTLTLTADGTGTVFARGPNGTITWKEGEDKTIELRMSAGGPAMNASLSDDGETMTLISPLWSGQLTKSEGK